MTPYYDDGQVIIYHGDCLEVLPRLSGVEAAAVITDPPYFRTVDHDWDNQWGSVAAFTEWLGSVLDESKRLLLERGTIAVFASPDMSHAVEAEVRRRFAYLNHIVWRKPGPGRLGQMEKESMRRFFPTSERIILAEQLRNPDGDLYRFLDQTNHAVAREVYADIRQRLVALRDKAGLTNREVDEALGKNGMAGHYFGASQWALPTEDAWAVIASLMRERGVSDVPPFDELRREFDSRRREFDSRRGEFDSRRREFELLSDVWTFDPPPPSKRTGGHPTAKPEALIEHLIRTTTRPGDLVLDPFLGSGTTARVAKDLGRRCIGIEKEHRYCESASRWIAQEALPLAVDQ